MLDVDVRGGRTGHFDLRWVGQEGIRDPLNLGRHRGREEQCLAGKWCALKDFLDVGNEPHVEHPVGFVHDHNFHIGQDQLAALQMVQQTARRRDQDINAFVDDLVLVFKAGTANQKGARQLGVFGVGVEILGHLGGKFPCRGQHQ